MTERFTGETKESIKVDKILEKINPKREGAPKLEMSQTAENELQELFTKIAGKKNNLTIVVRCWNKGREELKAELNRIEKLKKSIPELIGAFFAIHDDADASHQTSQALEELIFNDKHSVSVVPLKIQKYSWTAGLNAPAALMSSFCKQQGIRAENQYVLNLSFDVQLDEEAAGLLGDSIRNNKRVATFRTEDEQYDIELYKRAVESAKELIRFGNKTRPSTSEFIDANEIMVALNRNTNSVWRLSDIAHLGGFNPDCNALGGMEDHEFGARLLIDALQAKDFKKAKELVGSLISEPIIYKDKAWEKMRQENKAEAKVKREKHALASLIDILSKRNKTDSKNKWIVPEDARDFNF